MRRYLLNGRVERCAGTAWVGHDVRVIQEGNEVVVSVQGLVRMGERIVLSNSQLWSTACHSAVVKRGFDEAVES